MNQMLPIPRPERSLSFWVVYDHPRDHPGHFVARLWHGDVPTETLLKAGDLEAVRLLIALQPGVAGVNLSRLPNDDPRIVEVWI